MDRVKGYNIDIVQEKDKLLNMYNNEYGVSLKQNKDNIVNNYLKPKYSNSKRK